MNIDIIKEALSLGNTRRLFFEARNPEKWDQIRNSLLFRGVLKEIRDQADYYGNRPVQSLSYSLFKLFNETGSRKEYETQYFDRRNRLNILALVTLIDGDSGYLAALEDIIWAICDEYTWCLPAHLPGTRVEEAGYSLDRVSALRLAEEPFGLDLFAAETAFALAEILSLLEDNIAPFVVARGRHEIFRRVLEPYRTLANPLWWETTRMNWAAVCAGSIGSAALYLIEDVSVLAPTILRVLKTMDCFLQGFGADGACTEGPGYWTYGFGFFVYFAALLKERTSGAIDLFQNDQVKQIALFQQKFYLTGNYVAAFSDSSLTQNYQTGLTNYLKSIYPEVGIPEEKYRAKLRDDSAHRWAHAVRDLIWCNLRLESGPLPLDTYYFPDAQWLIAKAGIADKTVCLAVKGGHNDEPHNHNDVGSFIVHIDGDSLLADIGRGVYTRQYFGRERYQFLCTGSRGHSVPVIDGEFQKQGLEYGAQVLHIETTPALDEITLEIAPAYGIPNLQSLARTVRFKKNGAPQVVLSDAYQFEQPPGQVGERLVSFFEPRLTSEGTIRILGANSGIDILFDHHMLQLEIIREPFIAHEGETVDIYIIDFKVQNPPRCFNVEFVINICSDK